MFDSKTLCPRKFFKCYQDKWWAPPACRANPTTCLSSVTGGTGWGLTELVQQAFFHNIPVAFALAESSATYRVINKAGKLHERLKSQCVKPGDSILYVLVDARFLLRPV